MKKSKKTYHHGNLAESLLDAVDEIATQFGLEAVTLRACAKLVDVSPSSAFRHYVDKRALLTAFAARALMQLAQVLDKARKAADRDNEDPFVAVCLAYVRFALDKPAFFRAMWREEAIYVNNEAYLEATETLSAHLHGGFANTLKDKDPAALDAQELLAWSAVHGLACLFVDGPVERGISKQKKMNKAREVILALRPAFKTSANSQAV